MAAQPSLGTKKVHWNDEETRIAADGRPYTRFEFMEYYGAKGTARWEEASDRCLPPALEPPARLPAPTIAGAPQPGGRQRRAWRF